jgi:hypothetical protein
MHRHFYQGQGYERPLRAPLAAAPRDRATENAERWQVSTHEAAHALAYLAAGAEVSRVWLTSDTGGFCEVNGRMDPFHSMIAIMAGEAVDAVTDAPMQHAPDTPDMKRADKLAKSIDSAHWERVKDVAWVRAGAFVAAYLGRIEALACELCDRGELDGAEVARLLGPVSRMPFVAPSFKPADQVLHRDGHLGVRSLAAQGTDPEFSGIRNAMLVARER